ncbi:MAG: YfiR family protein [Gammaproteobacteria bacterium]
MQRPIRPLYWVPLLIGIGTQVISAERLDEAAVKAAFIYNFIKFIEWPGPVSQPNSFIVCATEIDTLQGRLSVLQGKMKGNVPIVLRQGVSGDALRECHVVFISDSTNIEGVLNEVKKQPIVTISDRPNFILKGGGLGLIKDGNKISFEINLDAINASGLHVSAQLLKLARMIKSSQ